MTDTTGQWGSPVEVERHRRIRVAVWAWAYEMKSAPLVDDFTYDREALLIDPTIDTDNAEMDTFFRDTFSPHTGQWVLQHPNKAGLERYFRLWSEETAHDTTTDNGAPHD